MPSIFFTSPIMYGKLNGNGSIPHHEHENVGVTVARALAEQRLPNLVSRIRSTRELMAMHPGVALDAMHAKLGSELAVTYKQLDGAYDRHAPITDADVQQAYARLSLE